MKVDNETDLKREVYGQSSKRNSSSFLKGMGMMKGKECCAKNKAEEMKKDCK